MPDLVAVRLDGAPLLALRQPFEGAARQIEPCDSDICSIQTHVSQTTRAKKEVLIVDYHSVV